MKNIVIIIISIFTCLNFGIGQDIVVSNRSILTLNEVFDYLKTQYKVDIAYNSNEIGREEISFISTKNLNEDLHYVCKKLDLEFINLNEENLLIRKKNDNSELSVNQIIIFDKDGTTPIEFAQLYNENGKLLGISDIGGVIEFAKNLVEDSEMFVIKNLIHKDLILNKQEFLANKIFFLTEKIFRLSGVEVQNESLLSLKNTKNISLNNKNINHLGTSFGIADPLKSLQLLPGVSAHEDNSSGIKIRGHDSDETLILIDNLTILKSDHFYGIFSNIDGNYIDKTYLYKNKLPIKYGGKTGGLVVLESIQKASEFEGLLDVNLLTSTVQVNIPTNKQSISLNYRTSNDRFVANNAMQYLDNINVQNLIVDNTQIEQIIDSKPEFNFYDLNAKYSYSLTNNQFLKIQYFSSKDDLFNGFSYISDRIYKEKKIELNHSFNEINNWKNEAMGINYLNVVSDRLSTELNISKSILNNNSMQTANLSISEKNSEMFLIAESNLKNDLILHDILSNTILKLNEKSELSFGVNYKSYDSNFTITEEKNYQFENQIYGTEISSFFNYSNTVNDKIIFDFGLRTTYYDPTQKIYYSPRFSLDYKFSLATSFKSSFSYCNQFLNEFNHENRLNQNIDLWLLSDGEKIPVSNSAKWMVGLKHIMNEIVFDVEFYLENKDDITQSARLKQEFQNGDFTLPSISDYKFFIGEGDFFGMDISISGTFGNFSNSLAYTWSKSTNTFAQIARGNSFPSSNDRRHQLKLFNVWKKNDFALNNTIIYTSGRPYLGATEFLKEANRKDRDIKNAISYLPAYIRIDLGFSYKFEISNKEVQVYSGIYNLFNRNNLKYKQLIFKEPGVQDSANSAVVGTEVGLIERTFNIGLKTSF